MDRLSQALIFANMAHKGQRDKGGRDYILHPIYVALQQKNENAKIAALLHDIVEDGNVKVEYLEYYFGKQVVATVNLLTRRKDMTYMDYIKSIRDSGNDDAIAIKIADLRHNADISRLPIVTEEDLKRMKKYDDALELLSRPNEEANMDADVCYYTCLYNDGTSASAYCDDSEKLFYDLSYIYAFCDCGDTIVDITEIIAEGKLVHYLGWQPNMLFEFADEDGEIVYSRSFPEWEH